jgi:hypothetical protein
MALTKIPGFALDRTSNVTFAIANVTGNLTSGNASLGNLVTANFFSGNGSLLTGISLSTVSNGNSNISIPSSNGNVNISAVGNSNIVVITGTGVNVSGYLNTTGNITAGNANLGNLVIANYSSAVLTTAAQPNITSVGTLGNLSVTSNIVAGNIGNATTILYGNGYNLTGLDAAGRVVNGTSNLSIASSGGNITMGVAGNAGIITVTGTGVNVSGYLNATSNVTANILISTVAIGTAPLTVTSTTKVTNLNADLLDGYNTATANTANTVAVRDTNGNISANYFIGNGSQLTGVDLLTVGSADAANYIANGTSNVNTPVLNGNITVGIGGTSNTVVFTSTGVNIAGYLNATGNLSAGNLSLTGNVTSTLKVTGNANVGNLNTTGDVNANNLTLSGNLVVGGTTTYVNSTVTNIVDPLLELGGGANGALLTAGDAKDRGLVLHRYEGVAGSGGFKIDSFMGWSNSAYEYVFASNATVSSDVVTVNSYGNVHANYFIGNGSALTGIAATTSISLVNGTSNVIVTNNGNVGVSVGGTANVVNITSTSANITGNANISGNITAGNSVSANYFVGSGQYLTGLGALSNGSSNISIVQNGNVLISAAGSFAIIQVTATGTNAAGYLNVTGALNSANITTTGFANIQGLLTANNANLGNIANANYFAGTLTTASQPNITTTGTLNYLNVSNATGGNGNITSINANLGNLAKANYFQGDGGLLTNIGSPNTVVLGTSNINIPTTNGNIAFTINANANIAVFTGTGVNIAGYANITGNANVGNLGFGSGIITGTGNITAGNANLGNLISANFISLTSNITAGNLIGSHANGNSNVNIPSSNGNVNISAVGNANILVVTGTGVNIAGTLNATGNASITSNLTSGNANLGNLASANYIQGTLITQNQPNIISVGTLLNVTVTANANIGGNVFIGNATSNVLIANTGVVIATGNITAPNANLGNLVTSNYTTAVLTTAAQPNVTSIGVLGNLTVTNNVSANVLTTGSGTNGNLTINPDGTGQLIIDASTPLLLSGNTLTSNGNVAFSGANVTLGPAGNVRIAGGTVNQYLKTDGSGNLSWGTPSGGGAGGTALTYTAAATPPVSANTADQWYNTTTSILYEYLSDGTSSYWIDIQTPTVSSATSGTALLVQDEGSILTYTANTLNFTGSGVTATNSGNVVTVTVGSTPLLVKNQGTNLTSTANTLNFTGTGVVATNSSNVVTVTVAGGITEKDLLSPFLLMGA